MFFWAKFSGASLEFFCGFVCGVYSLGFSHMEGKLPGNKYRVLYGEALGPVDWASKQTSYSPKGEPLKLMGLIGATFAIRFLPGNLGTDSNSKGIDLGYGLTFRA